MDGKIDWEPAGWVFAVVTLSVLGALVVVAAGRFDLVVFGAPLLGALAGAWWSSRPRVALCWCAKRCRPRLGIEASALNPRMRTRLIAKSTSLTR